MKLFSFGEIIMSLVTKYLTIRDRPPHPLKMSKKQTLSFKKQGMMLMLLMLLMFSFALSFNTLHDLAQQQGLRA